MTDTAIVVLNYINYHATSVCVDSIISMGYDISGIVIVDNHSLNSSYNILKQKYKKCEKVHLIRTHRNLGFARGNNKGITFAKKYLKNVKFVITANSDIVFTDKHFIEKMKQSYQSGIGMIGCTIYNGGGKISDNQKYLYRPHNVLALAVTYWMTYHFYNYSFLGNKIKALCKGETLTVLHGSMMMFTPDFFKYYSGMCPGTFLYAEELVLFYMCSAKGLLQKYTMATSVCHKSEGSSRIVGKNKELDCCKYAARSYLVAFFWSLRAFMRGEIDEEIH